MVLPADKGCTSVVMDTDTYRAKMSTLIENGQYQLLHRDPKDCLTHDLRQRDHGIFKVKIKFIDRDPYYYTRRVKEAIHMRLHPNNIHRDSGIEIPEMWMPTIKKHNSRRAVRQRTAGGANH
ncbi:hypothetical protein pdam_00007940 [Pocillopora damicornis]|uniref:Uncharacterized protein n=1 Tax=Pocillopora damicornis TaxID=46731 RepID=A0A3M6UF39_POCDA|nr:hypothetical protein pdam_00007940 [Pocillopora damicornis]